MHSVLTSLTCMPLKEKTFLTVVLKRGKWKRPSLKSNLHGISPGEDDLGAEIFKHMDQSLLEALTAICNEIYSVYDVPTSWSTDIIHPIHKSGTIQTHQITFMALLSST